MVYLKRNFLWVIYFIFVAVAIANRGDEYLIQSSSPFPLGKYVVWMLYLGFLGYSIYCSTVENFFGTLKKLYPFRWARQIGLDLYIGLILSLGLIYFNEGSIVIVLFWLLPTLIYANLSILLYVALNYDVLVSNFV